MTDKHDAPFDPTILDQPPRDDGGPAFPTVPHYTAIGAEQHFYAGHYGMSLRDYFAGQLIAGGVINDYGNYEDFAKAAYLVADALIAERAKGR